MIKCNAVKCKHNKNGYCTKEWNIENNNKGKESLFEKIKKIIVSVLIGIGVVSCTSANITEAKKEARFKKVEMDYDVLKDTDVGVIEDTDTGKRYMVVIHESKNTTRSSMQVLEIEE